MSCITILSDLGLQDASVASVKGILMQHNGSTPIIDISNNVEPFHTQQASYLLAAAYKHFAKGSFHLALFDIFHQKNPTLMLAEVYGHYFLVPDNGILPLAFDPTDIKNVWHCYTLSEGEKLVDWVSAASKTIKRLEGGTPDSIELSQAELTTQLKGFKPRIDSNSIEGQVIHIDRFENVVINITKADFETIGSGRPFTIQFVKGEAIDSISSHYNSVREGEKLCRFNSAGYLEIAINRGNAAGLFGLSMQSEKQLIYKTIKVNFE